jgi:hypothetical protein
VINLRFTSAVILGAFLAVGCGSAASPTPAGGTPPPPPGRTTSPGPSASSSSAAAVPDLTASFTSPWYGYSIRHPAIWTAYPAETYFEPEAWSRVGEAEWLDLIKPPGGGLLRLASAAVPAGVDGMDWIARYYGGCEPACEDVVIGGHPARLRDLSTTEGEIEATLVAGGRAYVFTLFGSGERALFDAIVATAELHPENAVAAPKASPSPS